MLLKQDGATLPIKNASVASFNKSYIHLISVSQQREHIEDNKSTVILNNTHNRLNEDISDVYFLA